MEAAGRAALERELEARGTPPLARLEWHAVLGSTSDRLKALARAGAPAWTVVGADAQTAGRGREGRSWLSPVGGLYLSVLLRPPGPLVSRLPLAAGVAVAEAVEEHGTRAELKWPNDVLVDGRKLAGILAEAASGTDGVEWVVLGIGLNVALDERALGPDLRGRVASLAPVDGRPPRVASLAASLLARLRVWYDALAASPSGVVGAWRERAVDWWGERVEARAGGESLLGRLVGLDEEGALILVTDAGVRRRVLSGDVQRLRRAD